MHSVPYVIEHTAKGERSYDIYSRLLQDRIILLAGPITNESANLAVAQLLYLDAAEGGQDIKLYINSPGGSITAGMAIYDAMRLVKADVSTLCIGSAASMGAFLLLSGAKGKRFALPNAEVMIHQPLGGAQGQATDIDIRARRMLKLRRKLCELIAAHTGQPIDRVERDTDRDYFMNADEALAYGAIDEVLLPAR